MQVLPQCAERIRIEQAGSKITREDEVARGLLEAGPRAEKADRTRSRRVRVRLAPQ